jgi:hypothetical protein
MNLQNRTIKTLEGDFIKRTIVKNLILLSKKANTDEKWIDGSLFNLEGYFFGYFVKEFFVTAKGTVVCKIAEKQEDANFYIIRGKKLKYTEKNIFPREGQEGCVLYYKAQFGNEIEETILISKNWKVEISEKDL